jgi:hypothetical protein
LYVIFSQLLLKSIYNSLLLSYAIRFTVSYNFIDILKPRLVIALGEHAAKWCELNKVHHERISHPQYWKRFNSKKIYPLIDILKKATV